MEATKPKVAAVIGNGVTGLASALALAEEADQVIVCGADDVAAMRPPEAGEERDAQVYALNHLSRHLLEQWGLWSTAKASGRVHPYTRMRVWDDNSGASLSFHAEEVDEPQLGFIAETRLIRAVLAHRLKATAQLEIACPSVAGKVELKGQKASFQLDGERTIQPDLLVGADGAHSAVRHAMGVNATFQDYGQDAVVALMFSEEGEEGCCWQCFSDYGISAWLPLGKGLGVMIWSCPRHWRKHLLHCAEQQFNTEVNRLMASRLGPLRLRSRPVSFPLHGHLVDSYAAGHCVLLGDAAHRVHPLAGQGANLGLADVYFLRQALRKGREQGRDLSSLAVLQNYQRLVKGRNWAIKQGLDLLLKGFSSSSRGYELARSLGLRAAQQCAPVKKWLMRQAMGTGR